MATEVLSLLHVPPGTPSLKEVVVPTHNSPLPVIAVGGDVISTVVVTIQPPRPRPGGKI